jgi:hypothetical protein
VRSPLRPLTALLTVEGERLHEARPITIKKICEVLESPARAEFAPQVSVLLNAWSRGQALAGGVEVFVHPRSRSLEVEAAADRSSYQPGETMAVTVSTRSQGQPVPAEVELGTVDESIFSLAADRSPDIRAFFARSASNSSSTAGTSDAGIGRRTSSEAEEHVSLLSAASEDSGSAPALLRHTFPDTLYWSGQLQTGPDGKAVVRIEAPDGLDDVGQDRAPPARHLGRALALELVDLLVCPEQRVLHDVRGADLPPQASVKAPGKGGRRQELEIRLEIFQGDAALVLIGSDHRFHTTG